MKYRHRLNRIKTAFLVIAVTFCLTGCSIFSSEKIKITAENFTEMMESEEYTIINKTDEYKDNPEVLNVIIANNGYMQMEYYEFSSMNMTKAFYDEATQELKKNNDGYEESYSEDNRNVTFKLDDNKYFYQVSVVETSLIYAKVDLGQKMNTQSMFSYLKY